MALTKAKTNLGIVEGLPAWNQAFSIFKGVPFAKAKRWAEPVSADAWDGVRPCFKFSATAVQGKRRPNPNSLMKEFFAGDYEMSEDCLYLNIWTPAESSEEKLPVAIYIHGGGFRGGYSFANAYDGEAFCKRGMVMVSIPYRLGVFGFLSHPELTAESPHGASGNYAILDQLFAIRWVKENIAAFGGDPDHIAIFGQSAGGMSVNDLCASPLSAGLFQYAIIQSADGGIVPPPTKFHTSAAMAEESGIEFLKFLGVKTIAEARMMDAAKIQEKAEDFTTKLMISIGAKPMELLFRPTVDGYVFPEATSDTYLNNRQQHINYMIGGTVGDDHLFGDEKKIILDFADTLQKNGNNPAYVYYFTYVPPGAEEAHHSVEHNYVFQTLLRSSRPYTGFDFDLSNELSDYWANFMKTGNPNGSGEQKWTPYTEQSTCYLEIGKERTMKKN